MIDTVKIKEEFPIFSQNPNLVYLDSAATCLKPVSVINKVIEYYKLYSANIHRGLYPIAERATFEYENVRHKIAELMSVKEKEIIFTSGTTASINLVVWGLAEKIVKGGENLVVTEMEHHANFVPWQFLAERKRLEFRVIPIKDNGRLIIETDDGLIVEEKLKKFIDRKTKFLALSLVSNVLGWVNPIKEIIEKAREINDRILVLVDAAQAVGHIKFDLKDLGADFVAFSGHKIFGPTGVGVLWGKSSLLQQIEPTIYGGDMIEKVTLTDTTLKGPPYKFEAGTPPVASVIGFGEAIEFLKRFEIGEIWGHCLKLSKLLIQQLRVNFSSRIKIIGEKEDRLLVSFVFDNIHPHDLAHFLGQKNICLRAGHHCAMPLHQRLKLPATLRASFNIYNDEDDVRKLIEGLNEAVRLLS